ncbi:Methionine sulfoxide reductase A (fragment) [Alteromonas infernus]
MKIDKGRSRFLEKGKTSELAVSTQISPENISLQHPIVEITTSHTTFATHLFLMSEGNSVLKGYAYAVHKGVTLDAGEIRLFDITKYLSLN